MARHLRRLFDHGKRRQRADTQFASGDSDPPHLAAELAQADELARTIHPRLHHEHQSRSTGDRPHRGIIGINLRDRLFDGGRLHELERGHGAASAPGANAASNRSLNCCSISRALARNTGSPMLPSIPVSVASIMSRTSVRVPSSRSLAYAVAVSRPTTPIGVPSMRASISCGGTSLVISTPILNVKRM